MAGEAALTTHHQIPDCGRQALRAERLAAEAWAAILRRRAAGEGRYAARGRELRARRAEWARAYGNETAAAAWRRVIERDAAERDASVKKVSNVHWFWLIAELIMMALP